MLYPEFLHEFVEFLLNVFVSAENVEITDFNIHFDVNFVYIRQTVVITQNDSEPIHYGGHTLDPIMTLDITIKQEYYPSMKLFLITTSFHLKCLNIVIIVSPL